MVLDVINRRRERVWWWKEHHRLILPPGGTGLDGTIRDSLHKCRHHIRDHHHHHGLISRAVSGGYCPHCGPVSHHQRAGRTPLTHRATATRWLRLRSLIVLPTGMEGTMSAGCCMGVLLYGRAAVWACWEITWITGTNTTLEHCT